MFNNSVITNINCGGSITINGKTYENIQGVMTITDEGVFVDGKPIEEYKEPFRVEVTINGDVQNISTENAPVNVEGTVNDVNSKNGNITVKGNILGNAITKNGNITAGSIHGDATTKNGNII